MIESTRECVRVHVRVRVRVRVRVFLPQWAAVVSTGCNLQTSIYSGNDCFFFVFFLRELSLDSLNSAECTKTNKMKQEDTAVRKLVYSGKLIYSNVLISAALIKHKCMIVARLLKYTCFTCLLFC